MNREEDDVRVTVRQVSSLLPHEETIPSHVIQVVEQLKRDGVQKDPVIIDQKDGVVLDGMHRLAAFRLLGLESVICSPVDYSSSSIGLHRWARVFGGGSDRDFATAAEVVGALTRARLVDGMEALERKECPLVVIVNGDCYLLNKEAGMVGGLVAVRGLDALAEAGGWERTFVPEDDAVVPINSGKQMVVLLQRLRKGDVVEAALKARLLPCKTT